MSNGITSPGPGVKPPQDGERITSLTPADIAHDLQVSVHTVMQMRLRGLFPASYSVGRRWRIDADDYAAWKDARKAKHTDPNRIEPRNARSRAALNRRKTA